MANSSEKDLQRAKEFRKMSKDAQSPSAKREFSNAADRLEERGAKKAKKVGRSRKRKPTVPSGGFSR